jgi:RNA polymerase sigma-70 factor (ECF subfamily)
MTDGEFEAVFHDNKDAVYRFAYRMTGSIDAAADVAQDCFIELLRYPSRPDPQRGSMRTFLLSVTRHIVLKRWRGGHRWDALDEGLPAAEVSSNGDLAAAVQGAVSALPPLQREAIILAEYEEMSLEEIARIVEAEVGTVKSRLHRARENLRRILAPYRTERR